MTSPWVLLAMGIFFAALLAFWFFVARPANKSYEERRMALQRKRIEASLRRNARSAGKGSPEDDPLG